MKENPSHFVTGLRCILCHTVFPHGELYTCPRCGADGILDVEYDYDAVRAALLLRPLAVRPRNIWRYGELLPVSPRAEPPHRGIGWTPVSDVPSLADRLGVGKLLLKDESGNPTASFKDRPSAVGVMKAREFGHGEVACASTGNAASSLAGLSAPYGLKSYIFVPQQTPEPKLAQLLVFGATVFRVRGSYGDAFELCHKACQTFGWYDRSGGTNPFLVEGKKTAGLEIGEQCRDALPDWVVVSVGDGCTIGGIGKGLQEMRRLGITSRVPRLLGVQAEGARPVVDAFLSAKDLVPVAPDTIADSIAVGHPRNWRRAIAQVRQSGGTMVAVTDGEILTAMRLTAQLGGVFAEPAAAAAVAGLGKAVEQGIVQKSDTALAVITGSGLKDVAAARRAAGRELSIEPTLEALKAALQ